MRTAALLVTALAALVAGAPAEAAEQKLPVFILPFTDLAVLESLAARGAVGLLVPDAGPTTSGARARAALVRGEVRNSLREGLPEGAELIEITGETGPPEDLLQSGIFVALPSGGEQLNDRRYPVAVVAPGYSGLLVSDATRIPGLVSIADLADTALGTGDALRSEPSADPVGELRELDLRIDDNGTARMPAAAVTAVLIAGLAVFLPAAALLGFAAALGANLALGIGGVSYAGLVVPLLALAVGAGSPFVARRLRSPLAAAWVFMGVIAAYLVAMAVDASWVALSPLGPTQNARFFGLSNLLETMFLVPAFAAAYLLGKRFGLVGFGAAALLTLITVAGSRFGADGGGAIVLVAGYAVLLVASGRAADDAPSCSPEREPPRWARLSPSMPRSGPPPTSARPSAAALTRCCPPCGSGSSCRGSARPRVGDRARRARRGGRSRRSRGPDAEAPRRLGGPHAPPRLRGLGRRLPDRQRLAEGGLPRRPRGLPRPRTVAPRPAGEAGAAGYNWPEPLPEELISR